MNAERPSNIRVELKSKHLLLVAFGECIEQEDLGALFARTLELFKARQRVIMIVDASNSGLSASQRKVLIELMREHEEEFRRWVHGSALVVRSALARGTLTALQWMMTPPYEQKIFSSLQEAQAWAERRARELEQ